MQCYNLILSQKLAQKLAQKLTQKLAEIFYFNSRSSVFAVAFP